MKIDTCHECKYFIWPTEYRFYGHCLMNGHFFLPDYMSCERFVYEGNHQNIRMDNEKMGTAFYADILHSRISGRSEDVP